MLVVVTRFSPSFVLMENVLDILKKDDGTYAKFAAGRLVNLRYQTRTGLICTVYYGVPQRRWRYGNLAIMFGDLPS
jgi:site-specific DNA-cytosine methylase